MASWFLLSAIGVYQLAPGNTTYSLGSPLHRRVSIELDNGRSLVVSAPGNAESRPFVTAAALNGKPLDALAVSYDDLVAGGELVFTMSDKPCADGAWPCAEVEIAEVE